MDGHQKIIVFDLDETLGYFTELNILWNILKDYAKTQSLNVSSIFNQNYFNKLLDLYPEFMRKSIYSILHYVKYKKKSDECYKIYIYTNNQCLGNWVDLIKNYIEYKIHFSLFDGIIKAYKIKNNIIEPNRSTSEKTYDDFIKCIGNAENNIKICMIDDTNFPIREHKQVTYIKVVPYIHTISFISLFKRFTHSELYTIYNNDKTHFIDYVLSRLNNNIIKYKKKLYIETIIDNINSKRIMVKIQDFFNPNKSKGLNKYNKTRKIRH
jgi:hypothetical protein